MRSLLVATCLLAAMAGFAAVGDGGAAAAAAGPELARLLRMMAVLKLGFAAGAVALVAWRMRFPLRPAMAAAYGAGCVLMAAGPRVIWTMGHVIAGAALVHGGFALLLATAWADGAMRQGVLARLAARARPTADRATADRATADRATARRRGLAMAPVRRSD